MFADDIVVFARRADRQIGRVVGWYYIWEWANTWEMLVGHAKCGIMLFGAARENANDLKRDRMDSSRKPIAVVEEYTYLPRSEDYSRFE